MQQVLDLRRIEPQKQYFLVIVAATEPSGRRGQMVAVERYGIAKRNERGGFAVIEDFRTRPFTERRIDALNSGMIKCKT